MSVIRNAGARTPLRLSLLMAALLSSAPIPASAAAKSAKPPTPAADAAVPVTAASVELAAQIELSEGKSTLMHLPYPAARLAVGDARVADVILINPSEVYMGKSNGATNLIIWNRANQATIIDIAVGIDTLALRKQFEQLLPNEKDLVITVSGGALILSGTVSDTVRASQAMALATAFLQRSGRGMLGAAGTSTQAPAASSASGAAPAVSVSGAAPASAGSEPAAARVINMMAVAAPQQVLLEVKIAEISKTLVDQLGASVGASISSGNWTYTFLSKLLSGNNNVADGFNSKNGNFLTLDAQKNDGLIKVLAEPTLMAISGQEASFLAGGKIFIPVAQGGGTGGTTITLEEKEFGIAVKFTPTVLEGGRINLRVAPEVSDLN